MKRALLLWTALLTAESLTVQARDTAGPFVTVAAGDRLWEAARQ